MDGGFGMSWEVAAQVATVGAILLGIYTLQAQRKLEHETAAQTLIHDQYELCRALDEMRVETPEMSHMLALPEQSKAGDPWGNYDLFKAKVKSHVESQGKISDGRRAKFYLQEHAVALHVVDIYEQTLFQRQLAKEAGDALRENILRSLCEYYEQRMLRNPRFRYHWDHGASDMMESSTRDVFDVKVRKAFPNDPTDDTSPIDA
jgi:hypothetical protein